MPLTITTWNVQNFSRTDSVYTTKLNHLVTTLQTLGSDVIALQDLAIRLGFQRFAAALDGRNNRVAFLTRNPLTVPPQQIDQWQLALGVNVRDFDNQGTIVTLAQFSRHALQITMTSNGR